jgi:hypothetical protein
MNAGRISLGAMLIAGLAMPAAEARACGHGGMAIPVPAVGHIMPMSVPAIGMTVDVLQQGYVAVTVNGVPFFRAGQAWYQPFDARAGQMYRVVPAPHGM